MNFRCQKLTSFDTGVTHFIGQNVIRETIPITLRNVKFMSQASLAIRLSLSLWLASLLSSLFIHVKVYCWYPLPKWLNFATFLKRFAVNRVTSLRLVVQKTLIHCSKTFTHTNIKQRNFILRSLFGNVAFLKSLSITLHTPRIIKDAYCLYVSCLWSALSCTLYF